MLFVCLLDWRLNYTENNSDIPFEQDVFRALLTLLGAKEKAEYYRLKKSLETYLDYLKKMKTNSRHLILSMGLEFHSQNLKNQLSHISSRMTNNLVLFILFSLYDDSLLLVVEG